MKKQVLIILFIMACVVVLAGCGATGSDNNGGENNTATETKFDALMDAMNTIPLTPNVKDVDFAAVGAIDGKEYNFEFGSALMYLFDADSDAYKAISESNTMTIDGAEVPVTVKDGYVLDVNDSGTYQDKIIELFNGLFK